MGKTVIVAKDQVAMKAISYDTESPEQIISFELTEAELNYFLTSGLIDELNQACGVILDDFEDDMITGYENLTNGLSVLKGYQDKSFQYSGFVSNLILLFQEAFTRNTAVYFFL